MRSLRGDEGQVLLFAMVLALAAAVLVFSTMTIGRHTLVGAVRGNAYTAVLAAASEGIRKAQDYLDSRRGIVGDYEFPEEDRNGIALKVSIKRVVSYGLVGSSGLEFPPRGAVMGRAASVGVYYLLHSTATGLEAKADLTVYYLKPF